jgi:hypothetical protein
VYDLLLVNEINFQKLVLKNPDQFDYLYRNFQLNNEILIANKDVYMNEQMRIVIKILNNREYDSIHVSLNNDEELIIMNEFDHHD